MSLVEEGTVYTEVSRGAGTYTSDETPMEEKVQSFQYNVFSDTTQTFDVEAEHLGVFRKVTEISATANELEVLVFPNLQFDKTRLKIVTTGTTTFSAVVDVHKRI